MKKIIPIFYACDDNFVKYTIISAKSLIENASNKLNKKQCDLIIANHLKTEGAGFQGDTNVVTIITQESMKDIDKMSKSDLSYIILKECMKIGAKK